MAISHRFLEKRLRLIEDAFASGQSYELDLRMCNIGALRYDLDGPDEWSRRLPRIVKLNASVNELTVVDRGGVQPFPSLTHLDVSVNAIKSINGLDVLRYLKIVNVSHNHLRTVDWMGGLKSVEEVDISMNELESLSNMPSLIMLKVLFVNDNKLRSLQGIQALPYLEKLEAQRNALVDVFPLAASRQLRKLDVSENEIRSLENTTNVLSGLPELNAVSLKGNPVAEHLDYREDMMKSLRRLSSLDGTPLPGHISVLRADRRSELSLLERAAAGAFDPERSAVRTGAGVELRWQTGEHDDEAVRKRREIQHLKDQLATLQDELRNYEQKYPPSRSDALLSDLRPQLARSPAGAVTRRSPRYGTDPIPPNEARLISSDRPLRRKTDYSSVKDTDEILRLASNELAQP